MTALPSTLQQENAPRSLGNHLSHVFCSTSMDSTDGCLQLAAANRLKILSTSFLLLISLCDVSITVAALSRRRLLICPLSHLIVERQKMSTGSNTRDESV